MIPLRSMNRSVKSARPMVPLSSMNQSVKSAVKRTNARPAANERSSTTERTVDQCGTNGCPAVRGRRAFVLWWTSVRSLLDERSFAGGRALRHNRCWQVWFAEAGLQGDPPPNLRHPLPPKAIRYHICAILAGFNSLMIHRGPTKLDPRSAPPYPEKGRSTALATLARIRAFILKGVANKESFVTWGDFLSKR
ncbi:hypothetical protein LR48_Vigan07g242200 [Vigna angularis]|uniref:Uncharacterized protein n=1 Tax=Phaseolus angularis TaxID=3914 RepID=A0A0L9V105_PHAAN|nr:hypothetical protein LR48_Vigan07g242200 [Vigna angularis]